jgi:hypothetical protein
MYDSSKIGRCGRGEGYLGTQLPDATRFEYGHQNGSRNRGLSAYRIRIQQSEVGLSWHAPGVNIGNGMAELAFTLRLKVSSKGRDRGQDLLFARADQNRTHGALYHPKRDNRIGPKHAK